MRAQTSLRSAGAWTTWQLRHHPTDPVALAHLALRSRSTLVLDALAMLATGGRHTADEVAADDQIPLASAEHVAALALAFVGMGRSVAEMDRGARLYEQLWSTGALTRLGPLHHQGTGQALFLTGRHDTLRTVLPDLTRLSPRVRRHLEIDLANPHLDGRPVSPEAEAQWQRLLSAPFAEADLEGLQLTKARQSTAHLFDRLGSDAQIAQSVDSGPLITVIMPCFRPDAGLLTSISSISAQSWSAVEILVVDDASGPDFEQIIAEAVASDPRARVVRMERNGGSYVGRNAALQHARGEFITFQDADDWSHPRRLEAQVRLLLDDPGAAASRSLAIRAKDDLTHQWFGYRAVRDNASSLMIRRGVIEQIGPFAALRKGADSEYAERIASTAGAVSDTGTPLAITRLRSGSLSRGDFTYQWSTPERLVFKGVYRAWHRTLSRDLATSPLGPDNSLPAPVPASFVRGIARAATVEDLPVAFLGDFSTEPRAERVAQVQEAPGPVGLWHLEDPFSAQVKRAEVHDGWFDLTIGAQGGIVPVTRVEEATVRQLVVLDPAVLLLATALPTRVRAAEVTVHLSPDDLKGVAGPLGLDLLAVADACREWFGTSPRWVPAPHLTEQDRQELVELAPGLIRE